jgi:microcystin-dependent protein
MGMCSQLQGGNQPHNNMQPYLTLNFCIALQGITAQVVKWELDV